MGSADGSDAPYLLRDNSHLASEVGRWFEQAIGSTVGVAEEPSSFRLTSAKTSLEAVNVAQVGQGIQQVLPIVTYTKGLSLGSITASTLVVEEPELHLHPAAHGDIADLFVECTRSTERTQVILETHSENLVLRIRRRVATGELDPADVQLLWFDSHGGRTRVEEINIRKDGTVDFWPSGIFAEDLAEVREIVRASR